MSAARRERFTAIALTVVLLVVFHLDGGFMPGNDAKPNVYGAATLLAESRMTFSPETEPFMFAWEVDGPRGPRLGTLVDWKSPIDGVAPTELYARGALRLRGPKYFLVRTPNDGYVSTFGPVSALAALPVFALLHVAAGDLRAYPSLLWFGGKFVAALFVALAAACTFLTARRSKLGERAALVVAVVFALATCAWSVLAQTLWQQSVDVFLLALGVLLLTRALEIDRRRAFAACGFVLGLAAACRPTSVMVVVVVGAFVALRHRSHAVAFVAGAAAPVLALLVYNAKVLGSPFAFGQILTQEQDGRTTWTLPFEGLAGVLVSPGRGLLVYSPVIGFALWGIARAWRERSDQRWVLVRVLSVAAAMMTLVECSHFDWWGGWTFGYRKIVDTMPLVVLGLMPIIEDLGKRRAYRNGFVAAFAWSVAVQALGVATYDLDGWNARMVDGTRRDINHPQNRARLWSLTDSPIAYHATHFSESRTARAEWIQIWLKRPSA
jgi:hypothetical protein